MTELSRFWDGTTVGDAVAAGGAPYDSSEMGEVLKALAAAEAIPTNQSGVFRNVDNQLALTPGSGQVSIATGKALVDGRYYKNDAPLNLAIANASVGRRDRIVLRRLTSAQTVRLTVVQGADNGSGTPPILVQDASTFDMPLFIVNKAIGAGAPTLIADERLFIPRHGDVSGEGGNAVHAYSQIAGAPAVSNATPVNTGPTRVASPGSSPEVSRADHVHRADAALFSIDSIGETRTVGSPPAVNPRLLITLAAGFSYFVEFNGVFGYSGSGVPDEPIGNFNASLGGISFGGIADGSNRAVSAILAGPATLQLNWSATGGTYPYFVSLGGAWIRATAI